MTQLVKKKKNSPKYILKKWKHSLNCGMSLRGDFPEKFLLALQMLIPSYFPTLTSYANDHVKNAFAEYISSGMKCY